MPSIKTSNRDASTRNINRGRDRWEKRRIIQGAGDSSDAALDAHEAAIDPHPQYTTDAEVAADIADHEAAANPHPVYLTQAEGDGLYKPISYSPLFVKGATWVSTDGAALTAGDCPEVNVLCQNAGTISKWTILTEGGTGSCVVDVWKDTYANAPPTVADTITAAAKPTVTTATKAQSSTLTGWTTSVTAGDIMTFKLDSSSTFTSITVILEIQ